MPPEKRRIVAYDVGGGFGARGKTYPEQVLMIWVKWLHTNVYGAENVVFAALRAGVKRLVALSTDKGGEPLRGEQAYAG